MVCIQYQSNAYHWIGLRSGPQPELTTKRQLGAFTNMGINDPIAILSNGGDTMASCFICRPSWRRPCVRATPSTSESCFCWAVRPTADTTSFRPRWRPASSPRSRPAPVLTSPDGALPGLEPVAGCNAPARLLPQVRAPRVAVGPMSPDLRFGHSVRKPTRAASPW